MGNKIQFKRGLGNQIPELAYGEPGFVSDEGELYIGTEKGNIKLTSKTEVENIKTQLDKIKNIVVYAEDLGMSTKSSSNAKILQNYLISKPINAKLKIIFRNGKYLFEDTITIPQICDVVIEGNNTEFSANFDNKPLFRYTEKDTHSWTFKELKMSYVNQQASINTNSFLVLFDYENGSSSGFHHFKFLNVSFEKCYMCCGILPKGNKAIALWGFYFDKININNVSGGAFQFSNFAPIGTPSNTFRDIRAFNENIDNILPFITCLSEVLIDGLDLEKWSGRVVKCNTGSNVTLKNVHIEHHKHGGINDMFSCSNNAFTFSNIAITFSSMPSNADYTIFSGNSSTLFFIENCNINSIENNDKICIFGSGKFTFSNIIKNSLMKWYRHYVDINSHSFSSLDNNFVYNANNTINTFDASYYANKIVTIAKNDGLNRPEMSYLSTMSTDGVYCWLCLGGVNKNAPYTTTGFNVGDFIKNKTQKIGSVKGWILLENQNNSELSWVSMGTN